MGKEKSFEEKMKILDDLSSKMEQGKMSLEESMEAYESGMKIIKDCEEYINNSKLKIEKITESKINEVE